MSEPRPAVVLDLDGTLVDSVYVHVLAWQAAFRDVGLEVSASRLHRLIGMGGDRLVAAAAGERTELAVGDELRRRHPEHLDRLFHSIVPTDGAVELLETLRQHGYELLLATSGGRDLTERLLDLLGAAQHLLDHVVTGADAEESKPSGQIVEVARARTHAASAVMVGDTVWDLAAARDAGVPCLAMLTGGISEAELTAAGAAGVHTSPRALTAHLRETGALLPDQNE